MPCAHVASGAYRGLRNLRGIRKPAGQIWRIVVNRSRDVPCQRWPISCPTATEGLAHHAYGFIDHQALRLVVAPPPNAKIPETMLHAEMDPDIAALPATLFGLLELASMLALHAERATHS